MATKLPNLGRQMNSRIMKFMELQIASDDYTTTYYNTILKRQREFRNHHEKNDSSHTRKITNETVIRFLSRNYTARKDSNYIFKITKTCKPIILYLAKLSLENEE